MNLEVAPQSVKTAPFWRNDRSLDSTYWLLDQTVLQ